MKKTYSVGEYIRSIIMFIILILIIYFSLKSASVPKTPATLEQINEVLTSYGYVVEDTTNNYVDKSYGPGLIQSIGTENDDLHFEFFVFSNGYDAVDAYGHFHSYFIRTRESGTLMEGKNSSGNYSIYSLRTMEKYSVAGYVGNTAVYAKSDTENESMVNQILSDIDYSVGIPIKLNNTAISIIKVVSSLVLLLMNLLSNGWLWERVCKSANVKREEVSEYRKENGSRFFVNRETYAWLLERANNSAKFKWLFATYQIMMAPIRICILIAVISVFVPPLRGIISRMMMVGVWTFVIMILAGIVERKFFQKRGFKS